MRGVNELANEWGRVAEDDLRGGESQGVLLRASQDLQEIARTAWHPVSEPPTEADSDKGGLVMVISHTGVVGSCSWNEVDRWDWCRCWARIRDVVLLPPSEDA